MIPEPDDENAHRKRIGSSGGRPVTYDRTAHRGRNVIERARSRAALAHRLIWLTDLVDTS